MTNTFFKEIPYLSDFFSIFFPQLCLICQNKKTISNQCFCLSCQQKLPFTDFHLLEENEFLDRFWGRVPIVSGAALFFLFKNGPIEELIYRLKYGDRPSIGVQLGRLYGQSLKKYAQFSTVDLIVPVPLHPIRFRKRGYNQSTQFAIGLAEALMIPYNDRALERILPTTTQTKKTRLERFENVLPAFRVSDFPTLKNKHILLVDDVLTTGATLEACAIRLLEVEGVKISMATIAVASIG